MKTLAAVLLALSVALLSLRSCEGTVGGAYQRADSLERVVDALRPALDSARARADRLAAVAVLADSSLAEAERRSAERIRRARERAEAAEGEAATLRDSLVAMLDSVEMAIVDRRDALHEEARDSLRAIISDHEARDLAQEDAIALWRATAATKDSVIVRLEARDSLRVRVNEELRGEISRLNREARYAKWTAVGLAANLASCNLLGVGFACGRGRE